MTPLALVVGGALLLVATLPAGRGTTPAELRAMAVALLAVLMLGAAVGPSIPLAAAGLGLLALAASIARRRAVQNHLRRGRGLRAALPDALELLAGAIDGGAPIDRATAIVAQHVPGPLGIELAREAAAAGRPGAPRLGSSIAAVHPVLRPFGALLLSADELGVPLAASLREIAADERDARRRDAREQAAVAAPRMMVVVGLLLAPAALLVIVGGEGLALYRSFGGFV